ncbi:MAG: CGGC domain-containing protein [Candidatus Brocadiae bacterium]|nr:CGGC domain-containing protein [Candidatus Brocadiia bacterium]
MIDLASKDYVVIVQCHIVKERCPGYFCEQAFHERTGGFAGYPADKAYRSLYITCGGCCGRAVQRKLTSLTRQLEKREGIGKDRIVVQLSSCMTKDNFHGPPCPHLDYIKTLIARVGLDVREDTRISDLAEKRRTDGVWQGKGCDGET